MMSRLALLALLAPLGCASGLAGLLPCPEGFEDAMRARGLETSCGTLRRPGRLVEASKDAFAREELETAYDYLALLHTLHPESAESREAFLPATRLFGRLHFRYRSEPDRWVTSEPRFLFGWLEQFFAEGDDFPQAEVDALFRGMRYPLFRHFLAYAEGSAVLAPWRLSAEKDNGIIQSVAGERSEEPLS